MQSPHFRVRTDLESAEAAQVAKELEQLRERPLSDAEVHVVRARLWMSAPGTATPEQPESGRAWVLLAQALGAAGQAQEALDAVERAATLGGEDAFVLNHVAWTYLAQGRASQAEPRSQRAMQLAPWVPEYLDTHAATLAQLGRCAEAEALQQRTVDALSENAPEALRAHLRERHASYARGCGAARP